MVTLGGNRRAHNQHNGFKYDKNEAVQSNEYLTPVYFNIQALARYMYDSRFYCTFVSETYGTIGSDEFEIQFGINSNRHVIIWLGDILERLPQIEQSYLLIENIPAQQNIKSEFYDAQIRAEFTEPTKSISCLNEVVKLNRVFHNSFQYHLYKEQSIEVRLHHAERYKRIVLNNEDDFKRFISELNEIINENVDRDELRMLLKGKSIKFEEKWGGNKLLNLVYKNFIGDEENLVAPFFYLYDLRLWSDHAIGNT